MRKIIPLRSLIGYSLIVMMCSLILEANLSIVFDSHNHAGVDLSHMSENHRYFRLAIINYLHLISMIISSCAIVMSLIFICSAVASTIEAQSENLAKLLLIGATRLQIFIIFLFSLLKPLSIATVLGAFIGSLASKFFSHIYVSCYASTSCGLNAEMYNPPFSLSSIVYTCLIILGIFIAAVIFSLKKFFSINALSFSSGRYKDASKVSIIRILIAILVSGISIWFFSHAHANTMNEADSNYLMLNGLELLNFYLYLPLILKVILPRFYSLMSKIFPITGLLSQRYFHATVRRYASLTAPIILCFMFVLVWFSSSRGTKAEDQTEYFRSGIPVTAAAVNIAPENHALLEHDLHINSPQGISAPVRIDLRFWIKNEHTRPPTILETNPINLAKIFKMHISGNLDLIRGTNIASARDQDKIGDVIQIITPTGKTIAAHIVAKIATDPLKPKDFVNFPFLIVNYQNFPAANMQYSDPDIKADATGLLHIFTLGYTPGKYTVLYKGITAHQLADQGISAISYSMWAQHFIDKSFDGQLSTHYMMTSPVLLTCLALVIVNSIAFGGSSTYIRRVMSLLGGTQWQDLRILLMQLTSIFLFAILLSPVPILLGQFFKSNVDWMKGYHLPPATHPGWVFPYQEFLIALIALIICSLTPPLAKMLYLRRKPFSIIS